MHLKLRREHKEDYMKVKESKVKIGLYRIVNKIMCSLDGGYAYFKGMLT